MKDNVFGKSDRLEGNTPVETIELKKTKITSDHALKSFLETNGQSTSH